MIKLVASSSNQFTIQPSGSAADGSSYLYRFTDTFSKDEFVAEDDHKEKRFRFSADEEYIADATNGQDEDLLIE